MNELSIKERLRILRSKMPTRDAEERARDFGEVNRGLSPLAAHQEALRCLGCAHPKCVEGCPVGVQIKAVVDLVLEGDYLGAAAKLREDNVLPAITGRVCPQETQCEGRCVLGKKFEPLGIGYIERFVADWERSHGTLGLPPRAPPTGRRVAIVGSGPAGLSAAGDLVQKGHHVTVMEALHEPGGVLIYGIPEFRLPKDIVRNEIENLRRMGVEFETNVVVGKSVTIDELFEEERYDAVFIATGAGLPRFLGVPGEDLIGVYSANELLTRVNLMHAHEFPSYDEPVYDCRGRTVAVIGGGNTALDAIRTALRLGAAHAMILYRRTEAEMPARLEELQHAKDEGIEVCSLVAPVAFLGDDSGRLVGARLVRMALGDPDASGRRSPRPIPGSEHAVALDVAIIALGTTANPLLLTASPELRTDRRGYLQVDDTLRTSRRGVFAGGDIVTGSATVISAMGAGRIAAAAIDQFLRDGAWP